MSEGAVYVVILASLAVGFFLGRHKKTELIARKDDRNKGYFEGLNYLLNEQPDKAIDTFIQSLEVSSDTLETHLALGKLLRKRGEVDRAVRIHQNLLARPELNRQQMQQAQYELAIDFVKSGLLDRAEELLQRLVQSEGVYKQQGLVQLLEIYQDEKEWLLGLDVLSQLSSSRLNRERAKWLSISAHFLCELAENCLDAEDFKGARNHLDKALSIEKNSVRSSMLLGKIDIFAGNMKKGLKRLQAVIFDQPDYIVEVLPSIVGAYQQMGEELKCLNYLLSIERMVEHPSVLLAIATFIEEQKGEVEAAEFVAKAVVEYPSKAGLKKLVDYYLRFTHGTTHDYLSSLQQVIGKTLNEQMLYRCHGCGFQANTLYWLCPSCKTWDGARLQGVSGSDAG
ncbi:lipopolysaccharide assembly protein LapB [Eionea flava]